MSFHTYINIFGLLVLIAFAHYIWLVESCRFLKSERDYFKRMFYERLEFEESQYHHVKSDMPMHSAGSVENTGNFLIKEQK